MPPFVLIIKETVHKDMNFFCFLQLFLAIINSKKRI